MNDHSNNIAHNIANRARPISNAMKLFFFLSLMADKIGLMRVALGQLLQKTLPHLNAFQRSAAALLLQTSAALRAKKAEKLEEKANELPASRGSYAAKRRWDKALAHMGKAEVGHWLDATAHLSEDSNFTHTDTGIMHGADRYPPRSFVRDWLDAKDQIDDGGHWRILAIVAIGMMATAGLLLYLMT